MVHGPSGRRLRNSSAGRVTVMAPGPAASGWSNNSAWSPPRPSVPLMPRLMEYLPGMTTFSRTVIWRRSSEPFPSSSRAFSVRERKRAATRCIVAPSAIAVSENARPDSVFPVTWYSTRRMPGRLGTIVFPLRHALIGYRRTKLAGVAVVLWYSASVRNRSEDTSTSP